MASVLNRKIGGMSAVEASLLLAVVTMPYYNLLNSYSIAIFSVVAFFSNSWHSKIRNLGRNRFFVIWPAIIFGWMALSLVWDHGTKTTAGVIEELEGRISWIVFPLVFSFLDPFDPRFIKKVFFSFVASIIVGSLYCLYQAYLEYKSTNYINFFFYHHLSNHIGISAIYYAMYCVFGIYILLYYYYFTQESKSARLFSMIGVGYIAVFIMLLSSKTLIFVLYLSAAIFTVYEMFRFRTRWGILIMTLLLVAIPVLLLKIPYVNARVRETQIREYRGPADNQNGLAVRGVLWESSWILIAKRPVFGWGNYGAQEALQKQYLQMGFIEGQKANYNSHNQYLFTWVCYGLVGLILLIIYLVFLFRQFVRMRGLLGMGLVLLFFLANITECMMQVQKGMVFLLLFANLLLFHPLKKNLGYSG
jgi:O-antigen ligase